jgi:glycosyltransferase involved in cell wall biosynthesis
VISFTGRIDINTKGLDYLIEIAKQLEDDWQIHVAGQGSTLEELRFQGMIQKHHLQEKVIWKGARKDEELIRHYLNSSIFISMSRIEGFGLVLAEAMSFGLPVIAFENSGSREVTENGRFGILVEQGNVERFCEQLELLMSSKELREKYQKLSLERVKSFNLEKIIHQWEKII